MDLFGSSNIQKMAADRDLEGLFRLLEHRNKLTRLQAAQALAELNDGTGWRVLMETVQNSEDPEQREVAAAMLGELGHPRAVPVLADILKLARSMPVDERLVAAARESLELIGGAQAEEALRDAGYDLKEAAESPEISDYDAEFIKPILPRTDLVQFLTAEQHLNNAVDLREAEHAEFGLVEDNLALWLKPDWAYAWYLRGVLLEDLERPYEAMLAYQKALHIDPSQEDARDALDELEDEVHPPELDLRILHTQLDDFNFPHRRDAAAALGELGDPAAIDDLLVALRDEEREVRHAAIESLGRLAAKDPDHRALAPLLELNEQSWLLRFTVIEALMRMGSAIGIVNILHKEMDRLQERNPVFTSHKDPLVEVEFDRLMEIGVLALERTGDVSGLLDFAEANAWEDTEEEDEEEDSIDPSYGFSPEAYEEYPDTEEEWDADEDLSSYVDEVAQLIVIALERLAMPRLAALSPDLLRRLSTVPDLTLLELSDDEEEGEPTVVYDLSHLREAAASAAAKAGGKTVK
jgi:HEAT repeat protein